jgi:hypothetical protein
MWSISTKVASFETPALEFKIEDDMENKVPNIFRDSSLDW